MPIKGLTDRGMSFPRIGELRKGAPKPQGNKPGVDLQYFRFTSQHADVVQKFMAAYGQEPTSINVYLPFQTADENFEAWIEEWVAGGLKWRGDGEMAVIWQKPDGSYSQEPKPQPSGGKQVGRLKVIVPELQRLAYVVALTTSIHDIAEMAATLNAYEALRGDLRGIPFLLSRVPRLVSTPGNNGQRVRREKWLWHLEAQPAWVQAQLSVMQREALPGGNAPLLEDGSDFVDSELVDEDEEPEPPRPQSRPASKPQNGGKPPYNRKTRTDYLHVLGVSLYADQWDTYRHNIAKVVSKKKTESSTKLTDDQLEEAIGLLEAKQRTIADRDELLKHMTMLYPDASMDAVVETMVAEANEFEPLLIIKAAKSGKLGTDSPDVKAAVEAYKTAVAKMVEVEGINEELGF